MWVCACACVGLLSEQMEVEEAERPGLELGEQAEGIVIALPHHHPAPRQGSQPLTPCTYFLRIFLANEILKYKISFYFSNQRDCV